MTTSERKVAAYVAAYLANAGNAAELLKQLTPDEVREAMGRLGLAWLSP